jgi:hypothetical protein
MIGQSRPQTAWPVRNKQKQQQETMLRKVSSIANSSRFLVARQIQQPRQIYFSNLAVRSFASATKSAVRGFDDSHKLFMVCSLF